MNNRMQDRALALAGVAQFTLYAHELGNDGRDLPERMSVARRAIFCTDPDSVMDVYGDASSLEDGISYLKAQLMGRKNDQQAALIARYIGQLLRLAGRLQRNDKAGEQLRAVIDRARLAAPGDADDILADGYQTVISPLKPRIMLQGHPTYLDNPVIQTRVRTLLLAAIRCGYMWRQCGGSFATLFFRRKALLGALQPHAA